MCSTGDHTEQKVAPVVLDGAAKHLLIDRYRGGALDGPEAVNDAAERDVPATGNADVGSLIRSNGLTIRAGGVLDWNPSIANAHGTHVAAENVTPIEGLASTDSIIKSFEVDC